MKISELKSPYKELAELRREQDGEDLHEDELACAFYWDETPEGLGFWCDVDDAGYPLIPESSLKELEESK